MSYGIRSIDLVVEDLSKSYSGPLEKIDGYDYIPWNVSAAELNRIFGFFGWSFYQSSSQHVSRAYTRLNKNTQKYEDITELGVECVGRLVVRAIAGDGSIIEKVVENVGYAAVGNHAKGFDTAVKTARSDALSRCCKLLGDALGLGLYDKPDTQDTPQREATFVPAQTQRQNQQQQPQAQPQNTGDRIGAFSSKQAYHLREKAKMTDADIRQISADQRTDVMAAVFAGKSADEIWEIAKLQRAAAVATSRQPLF